MDAKGAAGKGMDAFAAQPFYLAFLAGQRCPLALLRLLRYAASPIKSACGGEKRAHRVDIARVPLLILIGHSW